MPLRSATLLLLACCLLGLSAPSLLGLTYIDRLATRPSRYLVSVADRPPDEGGPPRPRRTAVVVLDGLGHQEALGMRSLERLRALGQCRRTDVGSLPLSRPVYGTLSTGVEQDRGGALINDATAPHDAESIWEIARQSGLTVAAVSEVDWWQHLFPRGFSSYLTAPRATDYFRAAPRADLVLIHPLYIDEAGHEHGAASDAYRAAVARADGEILDFMGTLDLERDLLVVTADHGHTLTGGHGGRQDRVAHVLTCYAGPGVEHRPEIGAMQMTSLAPSLSLLLGLRFPAGMRAGDDDLDVLWDIAALRAFTPEYRADRRRAVDRFRTENQARVAVWNPASGGSWTAFYRAARWRRAPRALPCIGVLVLLLWAHARGHRRLGRDAGGGRFGGAFGLAALVGYGVVAWAAQVALRGSFDMSSIENLQSFLPFTILLGTAVSLGVVGIHALLRRSLRALVWDLSLFSLVATTLCLAHPVVFGWHLDFPVPAPPVFFFPLFATLFLGGASSVALLVGLFAWVRARSG
jgi:hypothetical protein